MAIAVLLLLHVPPVIPSLKVVAMPAQMFDAPLIADGVGITVTVMVEAQPVV